MSCGVGHRSGLDSGLLWPSHRLAATAPIGPLAWEPPYAMGVALKTEKNKGKKKKDRGVPAGQMEAIAPPQNLIDLLSWHYSDFNMHINLLASR